MRLQIAIIYSMSGLLLMGQAVYAIEHPFSPDEIAKAGIYAAEQLKVNPNMAPGKADELKQAILDSGPAAGVNQGQFSDCWFESAVAAFAMVRPGRKVLSDMITYENGAYTVRFPDQPQKSYLVTANEMQADRLHDSALWARVLDEAIARRFPNKVIGPAKAVEKGVPNAAQGLAILSTNEPQFVWTKDTPVAELRKLLNRNLSAGMPMVAGSVMESIGLEQAVIPHHSYTVLTYDADSDSLELRNPYGNNTNNNLLQKYPNIPRMGQSSFGVYAEGAGLIKMNLATFRKYFRCLAWTNIKPIVE